MHKGTWYRDPKTGERTATPPPGQPKVKPAPKKAPTAKE
jgi:hypothetical protein